MVGSRLGFAMIQNAPDPRPSAVPPRAGGTSSALLGLVFVMACGRTPLLGDSGATGDGTFDGGVDDGVSADDVESLDDDGTETTEPPDLECPEGIDVFADGFEDGAGSWTLHPRWSVVLHAEAPEGSSVLWGHWENWDLGCPVSAEATVQFDLDLSGATVAQLHFEHVGEACDLDTLRVEVGDSSTGEVTTLLEPSPVLDEWTHYAQDLSAWAGRSSVRLTIAFDNVCGDACGVNWRLDTVRVCTDG